MLLWLLDQYDSWWAVGAEGHPLAGLSKITLRAAWAALAAFLLAVLLGPRWIGWLKARFREPNKSPSPVLRRLHKPKEFTPTMGGLFIVAGLLAGVVLLGNLANPCVLVALLALCGMAGIGMVDDLIKLYGTSNGLSARSKLCAQLGVASLVALLLYLHHSRMPDGLAL